jgi:hypothetical protein
MSATALRSVTADRVPENQCTQAAHETESTMIRLALTVLPLAPAGAAHAQQVRAALHYPRAKWRLHDIVRFQPPHGGRDCSLKKDAS